MNIILEGEQCFFSEEYPINWFLVKEFSSVEKNNSILLTRIRHTQDSSYKNSQPWRRPTVLSSRYIT